MAKSVDWIGSFIETELAAVIAWWKEDKDARGATYRPDSRFENDGSNFRSTVKTSNLPAEPLAQISEVVSCKGALTITITDGYTQARAKLSDSAVQVLENEIGEKIDSATRGDVISIKEVIIASTPYGPQDEHVQLEIQEIEYLYHLRKSLGHKQTIVERTEAARLLNEITEIRRRQYDIPESQTEPKSTGANANAVAGALRNGDCSQANESHSPRSQQSVSPTHSSQAAVSQPSYSTQPAIANRLPLSRKRKAPTLDKDGFEIRQGNNLQRPHGPGFTSPTTRQLPAKRPQLGNDKTGLTLLNLLQNKPKNAPLQTSPALGEQLPPQSEPRSKASSPAAPANVPDVSSDVERMSIASAEHAPAADTEQSTAADKMPSRSAPQKYSLRRIPNDQRTLLEKPDSWFPSLPGKQFPQPNIPIQLLEQWHAQASPEDQRMIQAEPIAVETRMETSDSSSESSEAERIPWSPTQRSPQLPPDSTLGSNNHTSPLGGRTRSRPNSSHSASQEREQLPPDSSSGSSIRSPPEAVPTSTNAIDELRSSQVSSSSSRREASGTPKWSRSEDIALLKGLKAKKTCTEIKKMFNLDRSEAGLRNRKNVLFTMFPGGKVPSNHEFYAEVEGDGRTVTANVMKQTRPALDSPYIPPTEKQQQPRHSSIQNAAGESQEKEQLPPDGSMDNSNASSPAGKQAQRSPAGSYISPMQKQQVSRHSSVQSSVRVSTPSRTGDQHSLQSISKYREQSQGLSPMASVDRTQQSKVRAQRTPDKPKHTSRPSTSGSIVKGTQLRDKGDMEMEMETSVPRTLDEKPETNPSSIAHRKARSMNFKPLHKPLQRQRWLQTTYEYDPTADTLSMSSILTVYKASRPIDKAVRPSEFAEAVEAAFPKLYPKGSTEAVGGLKRRGEKAPNARDTMDDDVAMANTDVPTAGAATNLRSVSAEPGRGVVIDLTNDEGQPRLERSSAAVPKAKAQPERRRTTSSASWGYANPVATDKDVEMLPPPAHVLNSYEYRDIPRLGETPEQTKDRVGKMEFLKFVEREVGKEKADEATRLAEEKRRGRTVDEGEEVEARRRWEEFQENLRNVKPGGAFADVGGSEGGSTSKGRGGPRRLDVLDWDV